MMCVSQKQQQQADGLAVHTKAVLQDMHVCVPGTHGLV
jgi:hypothetical protein